jgi:predicted unusual protein kinase regulating ubiquinone biosynthesis (AarF/ABC1/UbiB family)
MHRAVARDGQDFGIKVQYPGVRASINSDVDNVAALMRLPGLLPRSMDISPLLAEAKRQLHAEADYMAEAQHLARFASLLDGSDIFALPALHRELCTPQVIAMGFMDSWTYLTFTGLVDLATRNPSHLESVRVACSILDSCLQMRGRATLAHRR